MSKAHKCPKCNYHKEWDYYIQEINPDRVLAMCCKCGTMIEVKEKK